MPTNNAELAYAMLDQINARPELHNQLTWGPDGELPMNADQVEACGTTACAAGWTVLLLGLSIGGLWVACQCRYGACDGARHSAGIVAVEKDGTVVGHVEIVAGEALGLTEDERDELFLDARSRYDVNYLIPEIFGPRPTAP